MKMYILKQLLLLKIKHNVSEYSSVINLCVSYMNSTEYPKPNFILAFVESAH